MKKTTLLARLTAAAFTIIALITSCQKGQNTTTSAQEEQATVYSAQSETEAQGSYDDITNNVMGVNSDLAIGGTGIFGRTARVAGTDKADSLPHCVTITITPLQPRVFPKTVVMDFGSGCSIRGHLRSGKMTTVFTGRLIEPGKSATTTFNNFTIDSVKLEGTHKITNTTAAGSNQRQFTVEVSNGKLTRANGNFEEWSATRVHTQVEGNGTVQPMDDIFRLTGNSQGRLSRPNFSASWTSEIKEPLIKRFTCRWFSKGTIQTVRSSSATNSQRTGTLDFGDGSCDNKATLTVNGNVHQIVLR